MSEAHVRPYRAADRATVRDIAYDVGFLGESAEWYWRDRTSFQNIWTRYYTDSEPGSAFVAERAGRVVGFLLGCVDSAVAPSPRVALTREAIRRFLFIRPGTATLLWRALADARGGDDVPEGEVDDPRWPSHLHINLLPEARGSGVGAALMDAWIACLRAADSPGCHLVTMAENTRAVAFFTRAGFRALGPPGLLPGMRMKDGGRMHQQVMVRDLAG